MLLSEISDQMLRELCDRIVARQAPAVAVHAREIVMMVFRYAESRGEKHPNPADRVPPSSIATFAPRDRTLTPAEIKLFYKYLDRTQCAATVRLACKMLLLTLVRKSELTDATWSEIDFKHALWTIPGARMKRRNPHNVYLSRQAMDVLVAFKTCAGGSRYVLPSRYDPDRPMNGATLNAVLVSVAMGIRQESSRKTDWIKAARMAVCPMQELGGNQALAAKNYADGGTRACSGSKSFTAGGATIGSADISVARVQRSGREGRGMADIIQFPPVPNKEKAPPLPPAPVPPSGRLGLRTILWVIATLCWPVLRFIMVCDVLFQLLRALVLWDTPGAHAGWTLLLHYTFFCYLTWFVAYGKPDQLR